MVYRGSALGFKTEVYHEMADCIGPTVTIYQTTKDAVFGIYTNIDLTSIDDSFAAEGHTLAFRLSDKIDTAAHKAKEEIYCDEELFPCLENGGRIMNDCDKRDDNTAVLDTEYFHPLPFLELHGSVQRLAGEETFRIKEIEIFGFDIAKDENLGNEVLNKQVSQPLKLDDSEAEKEPKNESKQERIDMDDLANFMGSGMYDVV